MTVYIRITVIVIIFCLVCAWVSMQPVQAAPAKNTVVDSFGRKVDIPSGIKRIACMYAFTGHVVAMLGRADDIVAVSNGLKRDVLLKTMHPAIGKALVPKFQGAINIEELARTKPDIVFVSAETAGNDAEAFKLDTCGLTWLAVDFHGMEEQQQAIALIGRAIGAPEKAAAYNAYYRSCIDRVQKAVSSIPLESRIRAYHATVEPTRTYPGNSLPADWLRAAGVINVSAQEPVGLLDGKHQVSIEQIFIWNPDFILVNEPGAAAFIKNSPKWSAIAAVESDRVCQMPIGISRWGHPGSLETPLAILWTGESVYPDRFRDLDMKQEIRRFYNDFFNYELSDPMIRQILCGEGMRLTKNRKKSKDSKGERKSEHSRMY